ncbi:MAG TPA: hypothetical protein VJZ71_03505 [Phycisphaerae bacterium]|nr:hypothetical protein [Phycisphaerae bacterium]
MNEQERQLGEIEANEAWLARFVTPAPSAEAVARAKQAARRELARMHGGAGARSWKAWHGTLAAAAALALCVTVGWYAMRHQPAMTSMMMAEADVQPLWPEMTQQQTTVLVAMDDEISDLEEWSSDESWSAGGADLYYALEEALDANTTSQPNPATPARTSRSRG